MCVYICIYIYIYIYIYMHAYIYTYADRLTPHAVAVLRAVGEAVLVDDVAELVEHLYTQFA